MNSFDAHLYDGTLPLERRPFTLPWMVCLAFQGISGKTWFWDDGFMLPGHGIRSEETTIWELIYFFKIRYALASIFSLSDALSSP
jgi:hypothetical protein